VDGHAIEETGAEKRRTGDNGRVGDSESLRDLERGRGRPAKRKTGRSKATGKPARGKTAARPLREGSARSASRSLEAAAEPSEVSSAQGRVGTRLRKASGNRALRVIGRLPRKFKIAAGSVLAVLVAAAVVLMLLPQPTHVIAVPETLGSFVKSPTVARATATELRQKIIAGASDDVNKVVAAVYEKPAGLGSSAPPQVIVFIGGNLTGGMSASDLISAYMTQMHGAFATSPGSLGGQAACAPGVNGGPAECAWADADTFGVIVSASLSASALAAEMRSMRPMVEHSSR
jgi:hypothetical protein